MGHDIIVIGASYGGMGALSDIAKMLPRNLPAAVFVVLHLAPESPSALPGILSRAGPLPAFHGLNHASIEHGRIYVAPPDFHLLVKKGYMVVVRGPRENRHRPAVDPLFRSAAAAYGPRVVGVVLSGYLDDGMAGLGTIKQLGGVAVVQHPLDAVEASMPQNAINHVDVDHILPASKIAAVLEELARQEVSNPAKFYVPEEMMKELKIEELDVRTLNDDNRYGEPSAFSCPECGGVLWEIQDGELTRFRCRVGHAFSPEGMQAEQNLALETALWTAIKTLEESATLLRRLARQARERGMNSLVARYEARISHAEEQASLIRKVILDGSRPPEPAPPAAGPREVGVPDDEPRQMEET